MALNHDRGGVVCPGYKRVGRYHRQGFREVFNLLQQVQACMAEGGEVSASDATFGKDKLVVGSF